MEKKKFCGRISALIISHRMAAAAAGIVYFLSIVPMLILSLYDYPAADDYSMSLTVRKAYELTGSIPAVIAAAFERTIWLYHNWTGVFTSNFLTVLAPNVFGPGAYRMVGIVMILLFTAAVLVFFYALLTGFLGIRKEITFLLAFLYLLAAVHLMPEGGMRVEMFYWYSGAVNYTAMFAVCLLYLSALLLTAVSGSRAVMIIAVILGFLAGGGNLLSALAAAVISVLVIAGTVLMRCRKKILLIVPCAVNTAALVISAISPGNQLRASQGTGMNPVKAVLTAFYYTLSYAVNQWTGWAVLLVLILAAPVWWKAVTKAKISFAFPAIAVLAAYCLTSCSIAAPLYAQGHINAGRVQGILWLTYLLCTFLTEGYIIGWIKREVLKINGSDEASVRTTRIGVTALLLFMFGGMLSVGVNPEVFTGTSALYELASGKAGQYYSECLAREEILQDPSVTAPELPELSIHPELLYFSDITGDTGDWVNTAVASYYNKDSVVLKKQ